MKFRFLTLAGIVMTCFINSPVFSQDIYEMQKRQLEQEKQRQREFEEQQRQTNQQIQNILNQRGRSQNSFGNVILDAQRQNQQQRNDQQIKRFEEQEQQNERFRQQQEAQRASDREILRKMMEDANSTSQPSVQADTGGRYVPPQPTDTSQEAAGYTEERAEEYFENNSPVTSSTRTDRATVNIDDLDGSDEGGLIINVRDDDPAPAQPAAPAQRSCGCYQPYYMMDLLGFCRIDSSWSLDNPGKSPPAELYRVEVCRNPDRSPAMDEFH